MKKTLLILFVSLFVFSCQSVEEMQEQRIYEEEKASSIFGENAGPLHITGFFSLSSERSKNVPVLVEKMQQKFGNKVEMEYRRSWEDRDSLPADEASECARNQGKLEEFLDEYFENYFQDYDKDTMLEIALRKNLDIEIFEACLESGETKERIFRDKSFAKRYDIKEIPTFVVEQTITISESLDEETFEKAIETLLETLR
jgi:predicted DsbA family dithiol-disulfide isomerase